MTRREDLLEKVEESVFALMMDEVAKEEGKKALEENERLKNDDSFIVPESTYRKGIATIKRHFSQKNRHTTMRTVSKIVSKVAVIVLVMLLLFTTAFATIPEFRAKALNLVMEVFDDRTRIELSESTYKLENDDTAGTIAGWVPKDFTIVDQEKETPINWEKYSDGRNAFLELWVSKAEKLTYYVDTECAEVREITVGEYSGVMVLKGERIQIVYFNSDQGVLYDITGENMSYEDVICVAENVRRFAE